jgi:hypothetical protein
LAQSPALEEQVTHAMGYHGDKLSELRAALRAMQHGTSGRLTPARRRVLINWANNAYPQYNWSN